MTYVRRKVYCMPAFLKFHLNQYIALAFISLLVLLIAQGLVRNDGIRINNGELSRTEKVLDRDLNLDPFCAKTLTALVVYDLWVTFIRKARSEDERLFGDRIISASLINPATSLLFLMSNVFIFLWLIFGLRCFAFITTMSSSHKHICVSRKDRSK